MLFQKPQDILHQKDLYQGEGKLETDDGETIHSLISSTIPDTTLATETSEDINKNTNIKSVDSNTEESGASGSTIKKAETIEEKAETHERSFIEEKDVNKNKIDQTRTVSMKMSAIGITDSDDEVDNESSSTTNENVKEKIVLEDNNQQKPRRRFFSLMNLIKFFLSPVIEEFREIEKSSLQSQESEPPLKDVDVFDISVANSSEFAGEAGTNSSNTVEGVTKKNGTDSGKKTKFQCAGRNLTAHNFSAQVDIVNSTRYVVD